MRFRPLGTLLLALLLSAGVSTAPFAASKKKKESREEAPQTSTFSGYVIRVLDGDTIVLNGDRRVRLLDINTPELRHPGQHEEPYGQEAADALRKLVFGQYVTVQAGSRKKDNFDRLLGHVFLPTGGWVNGTLVREGLAHVYTFPQDNLYAKELLTYETQARENKRGIWSLPRWSTKSATTCCEKYDIGTFQIVEGTVLSAAHVKKASSGRTYLNFGKDWKTDFSVTITDKDMRFFRKQGIKNAAEAYNGKIVRVHGFLQPVNGTMVKATHPAQIEILE